MKNCTGSRKNLKTIEDMEWEAVYEADGCSNKKIRGYWLEVQCLQSTKTFRYQYGRNEVSRKDAIEILLYA